MQISVAADFRPPRRYMADIKRQMPFINSLALNEVGGLAIEANKTEMQRAFDGPTRWTLNAFHFRRATKARQFVTIERKTAQQGQHYLEVEATGGYRPYTGWERLLQARLPYAGQVGYVTPTKHMRRNGSGNVTRGMMNRVLSSVKAQGDARNNTTARSRKRNTGAGRYFVSPAESRLSPGIYERMARRRIRKVFAIDARRPNYAPIYQFEPVMQRTARQHMSKAFGKAVARAIATSRNR